ncbi:hypothetical protein Cgig2_008785 [Carnegiea gigantea]|uniref:Uncharacterized protein n=1 Tax=Carnegiea gigantea TaxID=171969 RepID=A0A9Q1Q689_9CARY|nr:hypothetical protein Cgig2_008785 [Carnegiea gigantea]
MGFLRLLKTDDMALYVLENFEWYRREVVFRPLPLPSNYEDLCLGFDLTAAEEAARDFSLLEMPQVVFLVMLLNDAVKLGVLRKWMIGIMESALKELRWSPFQAWADPRLGRGRNRGGQLVGCAAELRAPSGGSAMIEVGPEYSGATWLRRRGTLVL